MKNLEPKVLWSQFDAICQVPRPSKKEKQIIAFLQKWGKDHKLETITDETGNVLMRMPATKGYENHPTVVLQAHMDMVCEKNNDVKHDFLKDPIETNIDGEWVKAKGTTLGADNGIGMATMMAIMDSKDLKHPALECLFTVDEETGLTGAFGLKPGTLTGKTLINLDSEDDGELFIGCAGGIDTLCTLRFRRADAPKDMFYFRVAVKGLSGGHSGDDINKGRANANKLLARFLAKVANQTEIRLVSFDGGNLRNAIPREATAVAAVPMSYKEELRIQLNHFIADIENEYSATEPNFAAELESTKRTAYVMERATSRKLIYALDGCPNAVHRMCVDMPGLVETSSNLASVKMIDENHVQIVTSQRSSVEPAKYAMAQMIESQFKAIGAKVEHSDGYPGWKPNPKSAIANTIAESYERLFGKKAVIKAIHAGLECGLFSTKYPEMDMVSVGPTMRGVHSPDERLHIGDTQKFWKLIVDVLERL